MHRRADCATSLAPSTPTSPSDELSISDPPAPCYGPYSSSVLGEGQTSRAHDELPLCAPPANALELPSLLPPHSVCTPSIGLLKRRVWQQGTFAGSEHKRHQSVQRSPVECKSRSSRAARSFTSFTCIPSSILRPGNLSRHVMQLMLYGSS